MSETRGFSKLHSDGGLTQIIKADSRVGSVKESFVFGEFDENKGRMLLFRRGLDNLRKNKNQVIFFRACYNFCEYEGHFLLADIEISRYFSLNKGKEFTEITSFNNLYNKVIEFDSKKYVMLLNITSTKSDILLATDRGYALSCQNNYKGDFPEEVNGKTLGQILNKYKKF